MLSLKWVGGVPTAENADPPMPFRCRPGIPYTCTLYAPAPDALRRVWEKFSPPLLSASRPARDLRSGLRLLGTLCLAFRDKPAVLLFGLPRPPRFGPEMSRYILETAGVSAFSFCYPNPRHWWWDTFCSTWSGPCVRTPLFLVPPRIKAYRFPSVQLAAVWPSKVDPRGATGYFQWPRTLNGRSLQAWRYPRWAMGALLRLISGAHGSAPGLCGVRHRIAYSILFFSRLRDGSAEIWRVLPHLTTTATRKT